MAARAASVFISRKTTSNQVQSLFFTGAAGAGGGAGGRGRGQGDAETGHQPRKSWHAILAIFGAIRPLRLVVDDVVLTGHSGHPAFSFRRIVRIKMKKAMTFDIQRSYPASCRLYQSNKSVCYVCICVRALYNIKTVPLNKLGLL